MTLLARVASGITGRKKRTKQQNSRTDVHLCELCQLQPKYVELDGYVWPRCARDQCSQLHQDTCANPSCEKPRNTLYGIYCGPAHAKESRVTFLEDNTPSAHQTTPPKQICLTPGCGLLESVRQNGVPSGYCGDAHKELGRRGCVYCQKAPTKGIVAFCQTCYTNVIDMAPMIVEVPEDHERYKNVKLQFREAWSHNDNCPEIRAIYKVVSTWANVARYERYLNRIEMSRNFASEGEHRGNEHSRWHGMTRKCNFGDEGITDFCLDASCSLCCIIKSSYDLKHFGRKKHFGGAGVGIYTSASSSKSDSHSRNECTSEWKAMLLSKVVIGKGYSLKDNSTILTRPPDGYDSVIEEFGGKSNDDEVVVYNNDAIQPSYLVMYDTPE